MIYGNFRRAISDFLPQLHTNTSNDTKLHRFNVVYVHVFKNVCKDPSGLTLINRLGLNISLTDI